MDRDRVKIELSGLKQGAEGFPDKPVSRVRRGKRDVLPKYFVRIVEKGVPLFYAPADWRTCYIFVGFVEEQVQNGNSSVEYFRVAEFLNCDKIVALQDGADGN